MSAALVSIGAGPAASCLQLALPTFERYARQHGYEIVIGDETNGHGREPQWDKIPLLQDVLSRFDFALWIDADALITDFGRDIRAELRNDDFQAMAVLTEIDHRWPGVLGTGVWLLRAGTVAQRFLASIWELERDTSIHYGWQEMTAALALLGYERQPELAGPLTDRLGPLHRTRESCYYTHTTRLSNEWHMCVGVPDPPQHPRIKHWPGRPYEERARLMRAELGRD